MNTTSHNRHSWYIRYATLLILASVFAACGNDSQPKVENKTVIIIQGDNNTVNVKPGTTTTTKQLNNGDTTVDVSPDTNVGIGAGAGGGTGKGKPKTKK